MAKDLSESTLVMVESLLALVIHATDIHHNRASIEDCRVACTLHVYRTCAGELK